MGFVTVNDATVTHALTRHAQERQCELALIPTYATSRYGTLTNEEVAFINDFTQKTKIPLDPMYTGKMLFGIFASIERHQWTGGKKVLMIHTGDCRASRDSTPANRQRESPSLFLLP